MRAIPWLLCIVTRLGTVTANVEKTIFLGPTPVDIPHVHPGLDALRLDILSPKKSILESQLDVAFPSASAPRGLESWYILQPLEEGRRYEVRICWPATQPTDFWLEAYPITTVFDTPELISSLAKYSELREELGLEVPKDGAEFPPPTSQSVLLLRIQAAASFYSKNKTLMESPAKVDADIILDPFILNILPRSLAPTAAYITLVAIGAWFLSGAICRWLVAISAEAARSKPHTD